MDFFQIKERETKKGVEVYPDFIVKRSRDLMVRGRSFYAIWDEAAGLWSTDEYDVQRLVDAELYAYADKLAKESGDTIHVKALGSFGSKSWTDFRNYLNHLSDSSHQLDLHLTFANTEVKKSDHVSRRLPYALEPGDISAYDELIGTLYSPSEREKLEWATGAIVAGDARLIHKFVVLYGEAGTGKSTFLNILQQLFAGYYTTFEAKALTGNGNTFSTEVFKSNPLVAIQHDGDLSKIEDNTKLNSIVSHEDMVFNEKYKPSYTARVNAFLFMGTNKPVRITDSKSGLIRRLIDVHPSGQLVPPKRYGVLMTQIGFELGGIAHHCLEVYRALGKNYYTGYRPVEMMLQTDSYYNFMEHFFDIFKEQNGVSLKQAYEMYKTYCDEANIEFRLPMHRFRDELRNYFDSFEERATVDGAQVRSWYAGFVTKKFQSSTTVEEHQMSLVMDETESLLDQMLADDPAQYAKDDGTPLKYWSKVQTSLSDIDTTKLHYVKPDQQHIVIDFDLKDKNGEKNLTLNLEAASTWPATYAEFSQGGAGIHLHYIYDGDVEKLSRVFDDGIEVKVFTGNSSLRRKLSKCNNIPVAHIGGGLPLKEKRVLSGEFIKSEKGLRQLILRNLAKEFHPGTKPSIDFIHKILEDAYASELQYDVSDLRQRILAFAANSSNQADYCVKLVTEMKFKSEEMNPDPPIPMDERLVFFDVEVFPNLFVVCWKFRGDTTVVKMVNPSPQSIEQLCQLKLVGFYNRKYDNHILYGRIMGYNEHQLFMLSQKLTSNEKGAYFGAAYNLSWTDIYDFSSKKQGLKKFQIDLGLNHQELGLPWDQPVPADRIDEVVDYCANDVVTTEQVFDDRYQDYVARQILAELSGLTVNDTTQKHAAKIIFGDDKKAAEKFVYTDLSEQFPGYEYSFGKSTYRGEVVGEGGYVYAEPGMYSQVAVLDVASMHPSSIEILDLFGPYTENFSALKRARVAIKRGRLEEARGLLGGVLKPYLSDDADTTALSYALKIAINIVYGLTSASFDNPFRDPRNKDNIVAKRGALFMIDLKLAVQERGFQVVHIKTDSIKIPDATPEIIEFVMKFGEKYGYEFEHETTYEKFCLVNDAVYIAKKPDGEWTATGAQFAHPYVFKKLFSKEPLEFSDYCETKTVTTALYLRFGGEGEAEEPRFVGRAGSFVPVRAGTGGGLLLRSKDGIFHAATGTKGYFWREAEVVRKLGLEDDIDMSYFTKLADEAVEDISKFGDFEWFTS
jgi:energy-coupling factor transporter ATP-binding protein EcfA2